MNDSKRRLLLPMLLMCCRVSCMFVVSTFHRSMNTKTKIEQTKQMRYKRESQPKRVESSKERERERERERGRGSKLSSCLMHTHTHRISPFLAFQRNIFSFFRDLSFIYLFYVCFRFVKTALNVYYYYLGGGGGGDGPANVRRMNGSHCVYIWLSITVA